MLPIGSVLTRMSSIFKVAGNWHLQVPQSVSDALIPNLLPTVGFRQCIHSIDDFMPACFAGHPRPDIDQLPCVRHARAAGFTALTFPDELELSRIHEWPESDLNHSSLLGGDFGPE